MDVAQHGKRAEEAVVLALSGLLAVLALVEARERDGRALEEHLELDRAQAPDAPLASWNARELRLLPGLGAKRAVEIVRARWEGRIAGDVGSLDQVDGIGPETVARVRAELERRATGGTRSRPPDPEPIDPATERTETTEESRP